jgi:hypothetical protein
VFTDELSVDESATRRLRETLRARRRERGL